VVTYQNAPTAASRLSAILQGFRGPRHYDFKLYRSNKNGDEIEEIPAVRGARISLSNFRDHTWELQLPVGADAEIDFVTDFVKVVVRVWDGIVNDWQRFPMGLYYFAAPEGEDDPLTTEYSLTGKSLEAILMDSSAYLGYRVGSGTGVLAAAQAILVARGFSSARIDFPPAAQDKTLPYTMFFDPFQDADSVRYLRIVNALLAAGGFYALYTDKEGKFRTKALPTGPTKKGGVKYGTTGTGFEKMLTGTSSWSIDDENFSNSVVVQSGDANQQFLIARAENHDPNSRVSIEALQAAGRGDGRVQKEPFMLQQLVTTAEAQSVALEILRRESGMNLTRSISTFFDPRRDAREVYELNMYREDGVEVATGVWPVVGWEAELSPESLSMSHELHVGLNF
jgi:hypothetical protein